MAYPWMASWSLSHRWIPNTYHPFWVWTCRPSDRSEVTSANNIPPSTMAMNIASPWREQFLTSLFSVKHWVALEVGATSVPSNE